MSWGDDLTRSTRPRARGEAQPPGSGRRRAEDARPGAAALDEGHRLVVRERRPVGQGARARRPGDAGAGHLGRGPVAGDRQLGDQRTARARADGPSSHRRRGDREVAHRGGGVGEVGVGRHDLAGGPDQIDIGHGAGAGHAERRARAGPDVGSRLAHRWVAQGGRPLIGHRVARRVARLRPDLDVAAPRQAGAARRRDRGDDRQGRPDRRQTDGDALGRDRRLRAVHAEGLEADLPLPRQRELAPRGVHEPRDRRLHLEGAHPRSGGEAQVRVAVAGDG